MTRVLGSSASMWRIHRRRGTVGNEEPSHWERITGAVHLSVDPDRKRWRHTSRTLQSDLRWWRASFVGPHVAPHLHLVKCVYVCVRSRVCVCLCVCVSVCVCELPSWRE